MLQAILPLFRVEDKAHAVMWEFYMQTLTVKINFNVFMALGVHHILILIASYLISANHQSIAS